MNQFGYRPSPYILNNYVVDAVTGCWNWCGKIAENGYGKISLPNSKKMSAHRVFYEHFKGDIPAGMFVLHKCDNRSCINPDHLEAGTHQKNMRDRDERGRTARHVGKRIGSDNPHAKLTEIKVKEIKELIRRGKAHREIAEIYGVSKAAIGMIAAKFTWSHVNV